MSNLTGFTTGNVDLSYLFQPYTSGTKPATTGFRLSTGIDLKDVFQPYSSGIKSSVTGFKNNGMDLSDMFAAMTPYLQTGGTVTTNGSAVKITYNASNPTGTGLTQLVGSFSIKDASKVSGLSILLVSGGGGGGCGYSNRAASGGGGGNVRKLPCSNYVNNTSLNITVGLGGAGATFNITTLTGTNASRGGNSGFSVTSGTMTYTMSSVNYIGAAPHTFSLVNNGSATWFTYDPEIYQRGAGSGGGGGAVQNTSPGTFGTYNGGAQQYDPNPPYASIGAGEGGYSTIANWTGNEVSQSISGYAACAAGGGGGPGGTRPAHSNITLRFVNSILYHYNTAGTDGGNGTSITNSEFNNETITYGGGGGWACPSTMTGTPANVSAGGTGGGGSGKYNGTVTSGNYLSPYPSTQNGLGGFGGGGGGATVNWTNPASGNYVQGGLGGNGTVVIIFTLL